MRHWRNEIFWGTLALIVIVLNTWWFPSGTLLKTDSYSVSYSGKRVLYETLQRLNGITFRSTEQLVYPSYQSDRLLILGPARYPNDNEWRQIYESVSDGMVLVFASNASDPTFEAEIFGVSVEYIDTQDAANFEGEYPAETDLINKPVSWRTDGTLVFENPEHWTVLVEVDGNPQVAVRESGYGFILFSASDHIFSNQSMVNHDQAILAHRILAESDFEIVTWIDETLNSSGTPKILGILFDPMFRPLTLQLILIAILFGWLGSRRFGAIEQKVKEERRSIVEHVEAVGILYDRSGATAHCVQKMYEYLKSHLRSLMGTGKRADQPDAIAQKTRMKTKQVQRLFAAIKQSELTPISSTESAELIREMIQLIRRLYSLNDNEKGSKNVR